MPLCRQVVEDGTLIRSEINNTSSTLVNGTARFLYHLPIFINMGRKQKQYHFIYKTTNIINNKYYIGMHSTDNLNDGYIGSGYKLRRSVKKYGKENFKCEILEFLPDRNLLKEKEKQLVNEDLLRDEMCMNLKTGGYGGFCNEEHRKNFMNVSKLTQFTKYNNPLNNLLERKKSKNRLKKLWLDGKIKNNPWPKGKPHSEKTKKEIGLKNSLKQTGENNSQFGTFWITNGTDNKKIKKGSKIPHGWYNGRKIKYLLL